MYIKALNESLEKMLLLETKQDIENFKNKFGEDNYELFNKSLQRLKNNGYTTDIIYYTQKVGKEELEDLLSRLQRRLSTKKDDNNVSQEGIRGRYKYLGEKDGYKVYQPLDYLSSIDLGYNTGWCTSGRYGHEFEPNFKPSEEDAKEHFDNYTEYDEAKLYYFLDSKTMEGKYAIVLYPELLEVNKFIDGQFITEANYKLFNQADDEDYSVLDKIPYELIPQKLITKRIETENGLVIKGTILKKADISIKKVVIPNYITEIGKNAFDGCSELIEVTIPNSVTSIESCAFQNCASLKSIIIPDTVKYLGGAIFFGCVSLTKITLPKDIKELPSYMFFNCGFTHVDIPKSVMVIGFYTFGKCKNLLDVNIPESVRKIDSNAFEECTSLTHIEIPDFVFVIEHSAFRNCSKLQSVMFSKNNLSQIIEKGTYLHCVSLTTIRIPLGIQTIGYRAFGECSNLNDVYYEGSEEDWNQITIKEDNEDLLRANIHFNSK